MLIHNIPNIKTKYIDTEKFGVIISGRKSVDDSVEFVEELKMVEVAFLQPTSFPRPCTKPIRLGITAANDSPM